MDDALDIADAHEATLRRLREMSARLTELAYARASGAFGADDAEGAARWMEMFDRLARGLRLSIALEARAARERRRQAAAIVEGPPAGRPAPRWRARADRGERDPAERDRETEDDGLPADATFQQRLERLCDIVEDAAVAFEPRIGLIAPRRAPTWADVPRSLLELADRYLADPAPPPDSG